MDFNVVAEMCGVNVCNVVSGDNVGFYKFSYLQDSKRLVIRHCLMVLYDQMSSMNHNFPDNFEFNHIMMFLLL